MKPKKVVHILDCMNIGGVETWLMNVIKSNNNEKIQHSLITHKAEEAYFDQELNELDIDTYVCSLSKKNPLKYSIQLYLLFNKIKPDVVHSHVHAFSGLVMLISKIAGVDIRITHSHSDKRFTEKNISNNRKFYLILMHFLINKFSTLNIAVSENAAISLFGKEWAKLKKNKIIYCGVNYDKFKNTRNEVDYRKILNIPQEATVIGHIGRFTEPKNHDFLIDIFKEISTKSSNYYLVLVGDGDDRYKIEEKIKYLNLENRVKLMGNRSDVPDILMNLFDLFVFPSLWEGLPLTLIEAQFAKLPCFVSNNVTRECDLGMCEYLELGDAKYWADRIINSNIKPINVCFELSEFNIKNSNKLLFKEYCKDDFSPKD